MKCNKCGFKNIVKASYCSKCGNKFTDKEKKEAYNKTFFGKLEKIEKIKKIATLEVITGHIVFKIASLLLVLGIGLYFLFKMGIDTKILNSEDYKIFYNKSDKQYYLVVDDSYDKVDVSLYRPNRVKDMVIYHYDLDDKLIDKEEIKKDQNIELDTFNDDYYVIESKYSNKKNNKIKVAVYHESDIK